LPTMFFCVDEMFWMTFQESISRFEEFTFAICVNVVSRIAASFFTVNQVNVHNVEEEQTCNSWDQWPKWSDHISESIAIRIIWNTTRHSSCSKEVHWEECHVYSNEESSEVNFTKQIIVTKPNNFFDSEISSTKDGKDSTHWKYIVEVGYYIVSIVKRDVNSSVSKNYTSYSTNCKEQNKSNCKVCWSSIFYDTISHSCNPREDFLLP
jgi:hypothetical protein